MVSEGEEVGNLWMRAGGMVFLFWLLFLEEEGEGEEEKGEDDGFFLVVFVWLVGWLAGWGGFFPGLLFKRGTFLVSTFSYHAECGYTFFFFLFFLSLFFWLSWRGGWIMHLRVVPIDR